MIWTALGAASAFLAVALGAFAAHGLRASVAPDLLAAFETGARYQLVHAVALVALGLGADRLPAGDVRAVGALFLAGMLLFSGSLYALALTGVRMLGAITPLGGVSFLLGWAWLAFAAARAARGPGA
jgi:uncharacterized membrane protein YgdD (TMEM256/DUF423 family)